MLQMTDAEAREIMDQGKVRAPPTLYIRAQIDELEPPSPSLLLSQPCWRFEMKQGGTAPIEGYIIPQARIPVEHVEVWQRAT